MLVHLLVYRPIVDVLIWISYSAIPNQACAVPFSFDDPPFIISEFSISREPLAEEKSFILTVSIFVYHFALDPQVVLVFSFKNIPIVIFDNNLSMQFVVFPFPFSNFCSRNHFFK
jgi:hypothetical protein